MSTADDLDESLNWVTRGFKSDSLNQVARLLESDDERLRRESNEQVLDEVRSLRATIERSERRRAGGLPMTNDWVTDVLASVPVMLTLDEAAEALGVSEKTVRRMIHRREIDVAVDLSQRGTGQAACVRIPRLALAAMLRRLAQG